MSNWKELAHFLYGKGFWYANPLHEIDGLTEEQLFWIPDSNSLCILWHVGHIAHREHSHIGIFLQGLEPTIIPPVYEVFGTEWSSVEDIRQSVDSVKSVLAKITENHQTNLANNIGRAIVWTIDNWQSCTQRVLAFNKKIRLFP